MTKDNWVQPKLQGEIFKVSFIKKPIATAAMFKFDTQPFDLYWETLFNSYFK